jgi:sugar phosphate isomerase/epimerase
VSVRLAITPDGRWTYSTDELVSAASAAGFAALGINAHRVDDAAAGAYAAAGLDCHEVLALIFGEDESATLQDAETLAGAAEIMGATWVLTVFTTPVTPERTTTLRRCAAMFTDAGAGMAVEFSPLGPVASISDALKVLREAQSGGRAGLLIDSWHFSFGDSSWDDLAAVPMEDIAYVQFTDALAPESERLVRETLHRRALPGDGVLQLDRFATALLDRGWDGIVSVEVLNADLRSLPVDELVRRIRDSTTPFWG